MQEICVISALRTPIGRFGGSLKDKTAVQLGGFIVEQVVRRAQIRADQVDLLILGLARQAGCGPNPARQVARRAGLPAAVPAFTLNQACASGLAAVAEAARHIATGEAEVVVAAGAESMSNVPYLLDKARWGNPIGHQTLVDAMYRDGLLCPLCDMIVGETVEKLAQELGISRQEMDRYAWQSQQKAAQALAEGGFAEEIAPLIELDHDEHARADTTLESLARLKPVFAARGNITAGNSSGITDGASALILASRAWAEGNEIQPLALFRGSVTVGLEPEKMALGPVGALQKFQERFGWSAAEVDQIELNEAFAAQVIACLREISVDPDKVNLKGGAIALGHPIGCSGNRLAVTLIHELRRRGHKRGLATLCVSGGLGICAGFEVP